MHITQPSALSQFVYIEEERLLKCIINQTKESSVFTAYYAPSYIYHTYHSRVPKKKNYAESIYYVLPDHLHI